MILLPSARMFRGKPQVWCYRIGRWRHLRCRLSLLGASFWNMGAWSGLPAVWSFTFNDEDGFSWRRGAARTCSRSLFGDLHRAEALPGVMVASAAGLARGLLRSAC